VNYPLPEDTPSKYLTFNRDDHYEGKTTRIIITSKRHLGVLGEVKWFGRWRCYAFFPDEQTIWNDECLNDVKECIRRLHEERNWQP